MKLRIKRFFDFICLAFVMIILAVSSLFAPVKTKDRFKSTLIDAVKRSENNNEKTTATS